MAGERLATMELGVTDPHTIEGLRLIGEALLNESGQVVDAEWRGHFIRAAHRPPTPVVVNPTINIAMPTRQTAVAHKNADGTIVVEYDNTPAATTFND